MIGAGIYWIGDKIAHIGLALRHSSTERILKKTLTFRDERLTDRPLIDEGGKFILIPRHLLPNDGPARSNLVQKHQGQFDLPLTRETTTGDLEAFRGLLEQHGCFLNGLQPSVNIFSEDKHRRLINQLWYFEDTKESVDVVILAYDLQSGNASRLTFLQAQKRPLMKKISFRIYSKRLGTAVLLP